MTRFTALDEARQQADWASAYYAAVRRKGVAPARPSQTQATVAAREAGRRAARTQSAEVARILVEAGRPELIGECIGMSPDEVRRLLDRRADEPRASASDMTSLRRALAEAGRDHDEFWHAALDKARSGARPG